MSTRLGRALLFLPLAFPLLAWPVEAAARGDRTRDDRQHTKDVSPALQIEGSRRGSGHRHDGHDGNDGHDRRRSGAPSIDGSGNNRSDPAMNATGTQLFRQLPSDYADGVSAPAGASRPSPRVVSNLVCDQAELVDTPLGTSDFLWQWGQFIDHDLDLTEGTDPPEPRPIAVPAGDPYFDPGASGTAIIPFNRSLYDPATGTGRRNPRQQINEITGWIDASNVYGSDAERAAALRTNDGTGRLRTSAGDLLPFDDTDLPNATGGAEGPFFLAGDVRANEQVALTAMHTLFVREHNRQAWRIARDDGSLSGDEIYERARRHVAALLQVITYREFLPALLGRDALASYRGYDPDVDARLSNAFSTAAFRFGHSALPPTLLRLDADGDEIAAGHLPLRDAFFDPSRITEEGGIEPLLRGLARQVHQRIDVYVVDDVRNFLFGPPGAGGFDLPALNIQRGRDHGMPGYNAARVALGLRAARDFDDVSSDPEVQQRLADAYGDVDRIDLWVGGLAEDPLPGGHLGELFALLVGGQFEALRDGDRYWYGRSLPRDEVDQLESTRLSDVIRRNTTIGNELSDDVFRVRRRRRR